MEGRIVHTKPTGKAGSKHLLTQWRRIVGRDAWLCPIEGCTHPVTRGVIITLEPASGRSYIIPICETCSERKDPFGFFAIQVPTQGLEGTNPAGVEPQEIEGTTTFETNHKTRVSIHLVHDQVTPEDDSLKDLKGP